MVGEWKGKKEEEEDDFVGLLESHRLFDSALQPRLTRLKTTAHPNWHRHFTSSVLALRNAQRQFNHRNRTQKLGIDEYIPLLRDLSGFRIIFDLLESSEGLALPEEYDNPGLKPLKTLAAEFIALPRVRHIRIQHRPINPPPSQHRSTSLVRAPDLDEREWGREGKLSVQGAVNLAGTLANKRLDGFKALLPAPTPPAPTPPSTSFLYSLLACFSFYPQPPPPPFPPAPAPTPILTLNTTPPPDDHDHDKALCIRGLKDCIVGSLNWAFESELFFGKKVAEFWVGFLGSENRGKR
ncbi:hypothetical protein V5O48_009839 [Marasmius crinis-equi]|uniref:Uncharacterized protein n=1 Tax=Marasmius crinis-equi TaxID=585013 RepID=A0ABR3FA22_9AGAR